MTVRRKMRPETALKIVDAVGAVRQAKTRRHARRAVAAVVHDVGSPAAPPAPDQPFDRAGWAKFVKSYDEELSTLADHERAVIEHAMRPYFAGRTMDDDWRRITSYLRSIRKSLQPIEPAVRRINDHAWGGWPHGSGW